MAKTPLFLAVLNSKCPRCRRGKIFSGTLYGFNLQRTNETCSHCHMRFEIEPGFFYGAMYVSYAFVVAEMLNVGLLTYLITSYKQININYKNINGNTPLIIATENGDIELVIELISRGCIIDEKNDFGNTALMEACINNNFFIIIKLVESGANVNLTNMTGWTPIFFACSNPLDDIQIVEYLIKDC